MMLFLTKGKSYFVRKRSKSKEQKDVEGSKRKERQ